MYTQSSQAGISEFLAVNPLGRERGPARWKLWDGWQSHWEIMEDQLCAVVSQPEESAGLCAATRKQKQAGL